MTNHRITLFATILLASATACVFGPKRIQLTTAPEIPAAQSSVKVSSTDNGNTKLELVVQHLASPERVSSGATTYVVWVLGHEPSARPQNIGALRVDPDLNGSLTAVTPLHEFELFVTAEATQSVTTPNSKRLLYTNVSMK